MYIGSTCNTLPNRKYEHKKNYLNYLVDKHKYTAAFEIIKNDNYDIYLVEEHPCETTY